MKLLPLFTALVLTSCAPGIDPTGDQLYVPNRPIIAGDAWAFDAKDARYESEAARKLRFRDAWMSFHNYFSPDDVRARTGEFETWFAQTPTSHVQNGSEYQFTLDLFR